MNALELFVRHDAELDAFGYFQFLSGFNPDAVARFLRAVDQTVSGLARQPLKGRLRRFRDPDLRGIRSWRVD